MAHLARREFGRLVRFRTTMDRRATGHRTTDLYSLNQYITRLYVHCVTHKRVISGHMLGATLACRQGQVDIGGKLLSLYEMIRITSQKSYLYYTSRSNCLLRWRILAKSSSHTSDFIT